MGTTNLKPALNNLVMATNKPATHFIYSSDQHHATIIHLASIIPASFQHHSSTMLQHGVPKVYSVTN